MIARSPEKPKFPLGQTVATPGALEALAEAGQSAAEYDPGDLVGLAQALGHESLNTTARYTKRTEGQLAEASERLAY